MSETAEKIMDMLMDATDEERVEVVNRVMVFMHTMSKKVQVNAIGKIWARRVVEDEGRRDIAIEVMDRIARHVYPYTKIEQWMETRFINDMTLTPKRVAYEARMHFDVGHKMRPWLRAMARKVKRRVYMRIQYGMNKQNNGGSDEYEE